MTYLMNLEKEDAIYAVLQAGMKKIKGQLNMQQIGYIQDLFHKTVLRLAKQKILEFSKCENAKPTPAHCTVTDNEQNAFRIINKNNPKRAVKHRKGE